MKNRLRAFSILCVVNHSGGSEADPLTQRELSIKTQNPKNEPPNICPYILKASYLKLKTKREKNQQNPGMMEFCVQRTPPQ